MRSEYQFDQSKAKHILLLPGLLAPVANLFPLVRYLRKNQSSYGVTAIPLRSSLEDFDAIVERAFITIKQGLLQMSGIKSIVLFGHSHGGRVACELVHRLKSAFPEVEYSVVTAGTPMGNYAHDFSLIHILFRLSKAYRDWPDIRQPDASLVTKYIGFYSIDDTLVSTKFATAAHTGELIQLAGLSHRELKSPAKIGPHLLRLLEQ